MEESQLRALVSLLDDSDAEVLSHVQEKILSLGDEIIPFLEKQWEESFNPLVQDRIENLIHSLQFENLVNRILRWKEKGQEDLLKGMWIVATYQYPDLSYEKMKEQIEQMFYETWLDFKDVENPYEQIRTLNNVFFNRLKFSPNSKNFHGPGNSMLNVVLDSKKGNPITLCVVYMLIAQKLKLPVYGVNLPKLFVLTFKSDDEQFYINVFNRGVIFSKHDVDNYIEQLKLEKNDVFYNPCTNFDIVLRMLRNLVVSFEKLGERDKADEIKAIITAIAE